MILLFATVFLGAPCDEGAPIAQYTGEASTTPRTTELRAEPARAVLEHSCIGNGYGGFPSMDQGSPHKDWRQQELVIGDVGIEDLYAFRDRRPERFADDEGEYRAYGIAVIVAAGEIAMLEVVGGRVTFMVDPGGPNGGPWFNLSDGLGALRLTACDNQDTRFGEALIVGGAQCVRLRVVTESGTRGRADIPFAAECG